MHWLAITMIVCGFVGAVFVVRTRLGRVDHDLGSVSREWVAQHHKDDPPAS